MHHVVKARDKVVPPADVQFCLLHFPSSPWPQEGHIQAFLPFEDSCLFCELIAYLTILVE